MIYKHIAIDLDNTIINYNNLFKLEYYRLLKSKNRNLAKNTTTIDQDFKNNLKRILNETKWQKFQGKLYSKLILDAEIFDGFEEFLKICKFYKIKINIISHKTKFGHFDKRKIDIRKMALVFLKKHKILDYLISSKDIFFCINEEEKIKKINSFKYDLIIDDLSKILLNKDLNKNIKKIYFSNKVNKKLKNYPNWFEIINHIFDTKNNYLKNKIKENYKRIYNIKYINSFNAKIVLFKYQKKHLIYKDYNFSHNSEKRFKREILAYKILNKNNIKSIPKFYDSDFKNRSITMEYINGTKTKKISKLILDNYIDFFSKISKIKFDKKNILLASSNAITLDNIKLSIENRILELKNFNNYYISKYINQIEKKLFKIKSNNKKKFYSENILSISDVGIHNTIMRDKTLIFYDFEYFGLDNKAKLLSDFILHPKNTLSVTQVIYFKEKFINNIVKDKKKFSINLKIIFPLCCILWTLIILKKYNKRQPTIIDIQRINYYLNYKINGKKYKI